jgi:vancomycin resistance protein YoaR
VPAARRSARRVGIACAAVAGVLALGVVAVAIVALNWSGVYPGVRVGGADLGGVDRAAATSRLATEVGRWEGTPITLTGPAGSVSLSRHDLGFRYDGEATLAAALAQGRGGSAFTRLGAIIDLLGGRDLPAAYTVDDATLRAHLGELAGANDIQAQDGALRIEAGRVIVAPPVEGRGLDIEAALPLVLATAAAYDGGEVALPISEQIQPRLSAPVLEAAQVRAEALLAAPVSLRGDGLDLTFDAATIGSWLVVRRDDSGGATALAIAIDRAVVRRAIAPLAPHVRRDTQSAAYEYDERQRAFVTTVAGIEGRQLDIDGTTAAVVAALDIPGERVVAPVATRWRPGLTNEDIAAANRQASHSYLAGPLSLSWSGQRWMLTVAELARWITILPGQTAAAGPRLVFDDKALAAYLGGLKGQIDVAAVDAGYTMDDGTDVYRITSPSRVGRSLDGGAALKAALAALSSRQSDRTLLLPVSETKPQITEADVAAMEPERWIDADLTTQRMYAMIGKKIVYTARISSGKKGWETPNGTFHIMYRVENETMTSESIGAEEFYRLENVLYTQYFTDEGHALHYSWWKTPESFGTPSSHGCLSENLQDAEYFWNFAKVGTRVTIRGQTPLR